MTQGLVRAVLQSSRYQGSNQTAPRTELFELAELAELAREILVEGMNMKDGGASI
jgi:hypothetical protein